MQISLDWLYFSSLHDKCGIYSRDCPYFFIYFFDYITYSFEWNENLLIRLSSSLLK